MVIVRPYMVKIDHTTNEEVDCILMMVALLASFEWNKLLYLIYLFTYLYMHLYFLINFIYTCIYDIIIDWLTSVLASRLSPPLVP